MIVLAFVGWAAAAGAAALPDHIDRLGRWVGAVVQHHPGTIDDAAAEVAAWPNTQLQTLWIDLTVLADLLHNPRAAQFTITSADGRTSRVLRMSRDDLRRVNAIAQRARAAGPPDEVLRRGALLHSDIAMGVENMHEAIGSPNPLAPQRVTVQVGDGQPLDVGSTAIHWDTARMLMGRTPRDDTVRLWYRATAAYLELRQSHEVDHLARAVQLFPVDPDLRFLDGCLHEALAAPAIQAVVQGLRLPPGYSMDIGPARAELKQAENALRQAVARRPAFAEARLHYGRVLTRLGEHDAAIEQLSSAAGSLHDPQLEYFADLFVAAAYEDAGRLDDAAAAYESAARRFPRAQSPLIALTALARRRGDRAGALAALGRVFALRGVSDVDDPWWSYATVQGRDAVDLLDSLWSQFPAVASR